MELIWNNCPKTELKEFEPWLNFKRGQNLRRGFNMVGFT